MTKIDGKKLFKEYYSPSAKEPALVEVPAFAFAMIDGRGNPEKSAEFQAAIGALYSAAYTLKFLPKKHPEFEVPEFTVMQLESLWWSGEQDGLAIDRIDTWQWTLMIMLPDAVTPVLFAEALDEARRKKPQAALEQLRLERFEEGLSAQIMHVGPYEAEVPTIERLHAFIAEQGCTPRGRHHEIYLGDPRRTAPERLKTVLRQPVTRISS